ncbi:MAG: hypothetical protein KGQ77_09260, partial [Betaproteobacteria bacterium]|nr:hypothetical protein [Betaproteobacteria bacterium]
LFLGALASMVTGIAIALIFRKSYLAPLVAGAVLVALFIPVHVTLWSRFPVWYHVVFLGSLLVLTSTPALWALRAGRMH